MSSGSSRRRASGRCSCALTFVLVVLGPVFGWWLMLLGFGFGALTLTGLVYEFYRGDHAH